MLIFHPILVATNSEDEEGHLALYDGKLVAIFVRLAGAEHQDDRGRLYLEASFGQLAVHSAPTFASLAEAAHWLEAELKGSAIPAGRLRGDVSNGLRPS